MVPHWGTANLEDRMARRGKFARLVDDFIATVDALGGSVDQAVVAEELQQRIDAIAAQLRITPQTVLRSYIDEDWGRATATAMMAEVQQRAAPTGPPEHLAVRVAARLLAALGQAVIYAAINGDQQRPQPVLDLRRAGEAVSGLGLAIRDAPPDTPFVTVGADVAAWSRATLEVLRDQLQDGAWTFCPCGEHHGQDDTDAGVLAAVRADLLHLPATATSPAGRKS
ncbi:hypothetical protein GCM10020218_098420 [Dactylosporangium vinaceum]